MTQSVKYNPLEISSLTDFFNSNSTIIFLDSAKVSEKKQTSYLFTNPIKELVAFNRDELLKLLDDIEILGKEYYISGYINYEAGYYLEEKFSSFRTKDNRSYPFAWFGVFKEPYQFDHFKGIWNRDFKKSKKKLIDTECVIKTKNSITKEFYSQQISKIKNYIEAGESYQINFTYDVNLETETDTDTFELYSKLRDNQKTSYCALIKNRFNIIASFSPELFFCVDNKKIKVKPMKGTAPRFASSIDDDKVIKELAKDEKNRAENLMIVDLLRNDLGRICKAGTVITEKMFEVETHKTVHQMTSTVVGELVENVGISEIVKNIFPCGSVTGTPKIRSMEIINELESGDRGVYCGAVGFTTPAGSSEFSVPIRTLQSTEKNNAWQYRVGSGIVWDSTAENEWEECHDKCSFLTAPHTPPFEIIETLLFQNGEYSYLDEHILRMQKSAKYFAIPFNLDIAKKELLNLSENISPKNSQMVRLLLDEYGNIKSENKNLTSSNTNKITISDISIDSTSLFLYHKTTIRPWFKNAMDKIVAGEYYDVLSVNEREEFTEGARSSLFVQINGKLFTPPISSGLLPGVLRNKMLEQSECFEKIIYRDDIENAEKIFCGNSVRGLVEVRVESPVKKDV